MTSPQIRLAVLDLAGTTVTDDGAVQAAFGRALRHMGVAPGSSRETLMNRYIRATMGESKISVFRHLFPEPAEAAEEANRAFEQTYAGIVADGGAKPIPGAREAVEELRAAGIAVVLNTGFSPRTRDSLLAALDWQRLADAVLSPADAGRGRPYPDMLLTALMRTGTASVRELAAVGDTPYDMEAGVRAGAGLVVGVPTGANTESELRSAGADHVLASVADLPALLLKPSVEEIS